MRRRDRSATRRRHRSRRRDSIAPAPAPPPRAHDGGEPDVIEPRPLGRHRMGPYEAAYDVIHGYELERTILRP